MPGLLAIGCSARIWRAKWTLKRQKSISSHAASISAWNAVFDWPSIVAAFSVWRHGPASRSAALRMIAQRSSKGIARQAGAASLAAFTAASASLTVEFFKVPSTWAWSCGWTTFISAPPPLRRLPPITARNDCCFFSSRASSVTRVSRSALPGAYVRFGSLVGAGGKVIASMRLMVSDPPARLKVPDQGTRSRGVEKVTDLLGGPARQVVVGVRVVLAVDVDRDHVSAADRAVGRGGLGNHDDTTAPTVGQAGHQLGGRVRGGHQRDVLALLAVVRGEDRVDDARAVGRPVLGQGRQGRREVAAGHVFSFAAAPLRPRGARGRVSEAESFSSSSASSRHWRSTSASGTASRSVVMP